MSNQHKKPECPFELPFGYAQECDGYEVWTNTPDGTRLKIFRGTDTQASFVWDALTTHARPLPPTPIDDASPQHILYSFTKDQLSKLLYGTLDMFFEFRDTHNHEEESAKFAAVNEMFEGLEGELQMIGESIITHSSLQTLDVTKECDKCNAKGGYHFMGCYYR